jgi:hypothetical protein
MTEVSPKDRLERKKYKRMWRWESELMARMMGRFPSTLPKYMGSNCPKKMGLSS